MHIIVILVAIGNNRSGKEYNKISKYKNLEMEVEKMWYLKTTTLPDVVKSLGVIKKGTNKHINLVVPAYMKYKICTLWNSSFP